MALGEPAGDGEHAVVDRQLAGEGGDPLAHVGGDGPQDQRAEQHELDDAGAERLVAAGQADGEGLGVDGLEAR